MNSVLCLSDKNNSNNVYLSNKGRTLSVGNKNQMTSVNSLKIILKSNRPLSCLSSRRDFNDNNNIRPKTSTNRFFN